MRPSAPYSPELANATDPARCASFHHPKRRVLLRRTVLAFRRVLNLSMYRIHMHGVLCRKVFQWLQGGIQGWGRPRLPGWKKRTRNGWLLGSRSMQQDRKTDSDDEWFSRSGSSRRRSVSTALIITHRLLRRLRLNLESLSQRPAPSSSFKATPVWPGHRASGRILLDQPVPLKQLAICQASDDDVGMLDTQSIFVRSPQHPPRFSQFFAFRVGVPRSEAICFATSLDSEGNSARGGPAE